MQLHRFSTLMFAAVTAIAITSTPLTAHAIRPDYDGERGIEAQVLFGVGGFTAGTQRIFLQQGMGGVSALPQIVGAGFNFRVSAGYRIIPALSVGASFSISPLAAFLPPTLREDQWATSALTYSVGVYGRLYYLALLPSIPRTSRVEFSSWGDLRRLDPWVSLGVEFQNLSYRQVFREANNVNASNTRSSASIPFGLGFDYRVLPMLSVGVAGTIAPTIGSGTTFTRSYIMSGNLVTENMAYNSEDPVNLWWSVGLGAKYTLSL
ncbi:MAG: hypothetical protein JNK05_39810 [Myxococcales bacterium]|nr:hypothetical protein [Myxococcales bacterium]